METFFDFRFIIYGFLFKSYYVVWKLRDASRDIFFSFAGFKSYYVVWKLFKQEWKEIDDGSLNRTM